MQNGKFYIITYDIVSNKKRKLIADKLLEIGAQRKNKSVFLCLLTIEKLNEVLDFIDKNMNKKDCFFVAKICNSCIKESFTLKKDEKPQKTLFI